MKKIMFNDKFGLTQAVLDGRKTQTRRIITYPKTVNAKEVYTVLYSQDATTGAITGCCCADRRLYKIEGGGILPKYKIGEVVAVAQSYKDAGVHPDTQMEQKIRGSKTGGIMHLPIRYVGGWTNKLFVAADLMPHRIRITNVRVELLQDISDEDCLAEGIIKEWHAPACRNYYYIPNVVVKRKDDVYETPREAYAALIDKISGKGTWQSNPYVFVYDFELIKD